MYTPEITKEMINIYLSSQDKDAVIDILAEKYNKPVKSIIGKLSKEKVYIKKTYKTKVGEKPISKKQLVHEIAILINADPEKLQGIAKSSKPDLQYLLAVLKK